LQKNVSKILCYRVPHGAGIGYIANDKVNNVGFMTMTRVSVIIPAYNAMKYLPETLDSVLKQTYKDFEIIIINDSSFDVIEQWAAQMENPKVKLISQDNQGAAGARNTGINFARGEYIAFLDADDLWEPTKLEKQVCALQENPEVGLVYTWVNRVDEKGKSIGKPFKSFLEGNVWEKLIEKNVVAPSSECFVAPASKAQELLTKV